MIKSFELAYLFLKDLAAQEPGNALALVGAEPGAGALVPQARMLAQLPSQTMVLAMALAQCFPQARMA